MSDVLVGLLAIAVSITGSAFWGFHRIGLKMTRIETQLEDFITRMDRKIDTMDDRLNAHGETTRNHGERIAVLEAGCG